MAVLRSACLPAATLSNNDRGIGVSLLGNYEQEILSPAARSALVKLLAWKSSLHGINPLGSTTWYNNKTRRYEAMPTINGHRDTYFTACPGRNAYPFIPAIRREVASLMGSPSTPNVSAATAFRDFDGMADADILGRDAGGRLMLSSPNGKGDMTPMEHIGSGWGSFDVVTIVGDWNGDGTHDILARKASTAELWLYPGNGRGGFLPPKRIGTGWNAMKTIVAPGDWTGDGKPDLLATNSSNWKMYLYEGDGRGGFARGGVAIGTGWSAVTAFAGVGDWDGDGHSDLAAKTASGLGVMYYGSGKGTFASQANQTGSWGAYATLTGIANAFGDKKPGILGVDASGNTYLGARSSATEVSWTKAARSYSGYGIFGG